jgi:acetylornithine aminotransferase
MPSDDFLRSLSELCKQYGTLLILDEIQCGYGRTGRFFAHQYAGIQPDLITLAKGMGNGFPIGGLMVRPGIKPWHGMLGTTFGGNHLACVAGLAVLEAIRDENLMENARLMGAYMREALSDISDIQQVRGRGLMIGIAFDFPVEPLRTRLLHEAGIFTGSSSPNVLRILPPLSLNKSEIDIFVESLASMLEQQEAIRQE